MKKKASSPTMPAYDRIAIEVLGNDAGSIETLRKFFGEVEGILGKPETWTTKSE